MDKLAKRVELSSERGWRRAFSALALAAVALTHIGCGGGGEAPAAATGGAPVSGGVTTTPSGREQTLVVQALDAGGRPVAGVGVDLNGGFNGMSRVTDSEGKASFSFTAGPVGEASVGVFSSTHYRASRRFRLENVQGQILQLELLRLVQAKVEVKGVSAEVSSDASALSVAADIAVTDENGQLITTLTVASFHVPVQDCDGGYGVCFVDASGITSDGSFSPAPSPNPVSATIVGTPMESYRVRFGLLAAPGTFRSGKTAVPFLEIRLGTDTLVYQHLVVRL